MTQPVIVTMRHARAARIAGTGVLCADGVRGWFAMHGLDYRAFLRGGMPIEQVEQIDDAFARRVCAIAREDAAHG